MKEQCFSSNNNFMRLYIFIFINILLTIILLLTTYITFKANVAQLKTEHDTILEVVRKTTEELERNSALVSEPSQLFFSNELGKQCGGTLVAENESIQFRFLKGHPGRGKCIWTIRANRRSKVTFYFEGYRGSNKLRSFISLAPYHSYMTVSNTTAEPIKMLFEDAGPYEVDGPLVFVTLFYIPEDDSDAFSNIKLNFFGSSSNTKDSIKYSHYHFTQYSGKLKYPFDSTVYETNEIATFTVSPSQYTHISMKLIDLNIDYDRLCPFDSLTVLALKPELPFYFYYVKYGIPDEDWRFCGQHFNYTLEPYPAFILIFKSDGSNEFTGFNISWKVYS